MENRVLPKILDDTFTLQINIGNKCNLNCIYCDSRFDYGKQDLKQIYDLIDQVLSYNIRKLIVISTNAEPFMNIKRLIEVISYLNLKCTIKDIDFLYSITTNGTLLDRSDVKEFINKWRTRILLILSLNGIKKVHDYDRDNSFDLVMKNYDKSLFKHISCTILPENVEFIYENFLFFLNEIQLPLIDIRPAYNYKLWTDENWIVFEQQFKLVLDYIKNNNIDLDICYITKRSKGLERTLNISKLDILDDYIKSNKFKNNDQTLNIPFDLLDSKCFDCTELYECRVWNHSGFDRLNRCNFIKITKKLNEYYTFIKD
jgi:sulfatase maturation enzyme AslB (radical SAM superfamily)